jgi:hypothetical protein
MRGAQIPGDRGVAAKSDVPAEESALGEWLAATMVLAAAAICALAQVLMR